MATPKIDERPRPGHRVEYAALRAVNLIVAPVPFSRLSVLAAIIVFVLGPFAGRARRRVDANLRLAFPELSDAERRRLRQANLRHTVRVGLEVLQSWKFRDPRHTDRYLHPEREDLLPEIQAKENPLIFVEGHFGNWEFPIIFAARHGVPIYFMAKRMNNPLVQRWLHRRREGYGGFPVYTDQLSTFVRAVMGKKWAALVADQNARRHGIFVDFFGTPASTFQGPAVYAYRSNRPLVLFVSRYRGRGVYGMDQIAISKRPREEFTSQEEAEVEITRRWMGALEAEIRKDPCRYFWLHRRWKTRPAPEVAPEATPDRASSPA